MLGKQDMLVQMEEPLEQAIWVDVLEPTHAERQLIANAFNVFLPLHHEMHQIEHSNRFYEENGAIYLSANLITKAAPVPESHVVTFVLTKTKLITLRYSDPNPILSFIQQIDIRHYSAKNHLDIFLLLLDKIVGTVADIFELIGDQTDTLALTLIGSIAESSPPKHGKNLNKTLRDINFLQNLLSKAYQCLSSLRMLIDYFEDNQDKVFNEKVVHPQKTLNNDIQILTKHGEYLSQKLSFQLQSSFGLINIEQTQIIKVFTVLAMVFMPPTLIASIYGMNFHHMPEIGSTYGYPITLVLMFGSSFLPYQFFKRKGWI